MSARFSVLALHFQNAVVHPDGVVARRGNAQQVLERKVLSNVKRLFASAREAGVPVIHVACSNPPEPPAVASSSTTTRRRLLARRSCITTEFSRFPIPALRTC